MQTPLRIETDCWVLNDGAVSHLTYHLLNDRSIIVLTTGCQPGVRKPGAYKAIFNIPANLLNSGRYYLNLLIVQTENQVTHENDGIAAFTIVDPSERDGAYMGREPVSSNRPFLDYNTVCGDKIGS